MQRLDRSESRERWRQVRDLWNEFDPIGVMGMKDWPQDEYEAYLGQTLRLLEQGASLEKIEQFLTMVTLEHMGLSETPQFQVSRRAFAMSLRDWYTEHWPETHV